MVFVSKTKKCFWFFALFFWASSASANLCTKDHITDRYRQEARLINLQAFAPAHPDYRGNADYNAWVLACNRQRDNNGKKIDKRINPKAGGDFAADLTPVVVKGKYSFYGQHFTTIANVAETALSAGAITAGAGLPAVGAGLALASNPVQLKYRYRLHREKGNWIVTLPIELHFPNKPLKNRLDISYELAVKLGLMSIKGSGNLKCDRPNIKLSSKKKKKKNLVDTGFIITTDSNGDATYSCRLPLDYKLTDGRKLLDEYYKFWRLAIRTAWNRPGFTVNVKFVGYDQISDDLMSSFNKDNVTWKIFLDQDPEQRARYVPGFARLKHIYTGTDGATIAHETGHYLGLDDEYRENDKGSKNAWRDCQIQGGKGYLMCSHTYAATASNKYTYPGGISTPDAAKGIYPWIITRRYTVAKVEFCNSENDCKASEYCAETIVDLKRKHCVARKGEGEKCSADKQCVQGAICKGNPFGKCIIEGSVPLGGSCVKDAQCKSGSCNNVGMCQCKQDSDCGNGMYCDTGGVLGIGVNSCRKMASPDCPSGWAYEIRNPVNKDRCNKRTTLSKPLECKLLISDKAKNWTGPHAQKGADECRSKKGKKPKGVKCPAGYKYNIKSGADTCTKVVEDHRTPTCPGGYDYKSLGGKDQCRKK